LRIIHTAFSIYLRPGPRVARWHFDRQLAGGGGLPDVGIYCINTVRYLTGKEPLEAEAYQWTVAPDVFREVDEHIAFRLKFPDGLVMQATSSWGAASSSFLRVIGEKGYATLDPAFEYDEVRRLYGKVGNRWFDKKYKIINELALELDGLADAVRQNRDVEPTGAEGLRDVAIMEAIYQAAREGHTVPCAPA
jgi:predicted dehydrogenase